jgi:hypothetical protein
MLRRIDPKLRLSYSLYKLWLKSDWYGIWEYLTETSRISNESQAKGKLVHTWLEEHGLPKKLQDITGKFKGNIILDYKTGSLSGYTDQLNFYAWLKSNVGNLEEGKEIKMEVEYEDYVAVGIMDYFIPGNGQSHAILAQVKPVYNEEKIQEIIVSKTACYHVTQKWLKPWELILDEVANSIKYRIHEGDLDNFMENMFF